MSNVVDLAARRKPATDEPRQAIRAFVNSLIYHPQVADDTATVSVPLELLDRLMCAAVDGGEGS